MLLRDRPADAELVGDLGVVEALDERGQHFLLTGRKRRRGGIDRQEPFHLGGDEGLAGGDGTDGREQRAVVRRFHDRARRAGRDRRGDGVRRGVGGEDDDPGFRELGVDLGRGGDAVLLRHHQVHDDDVRM